MKVDALIEAALRDGPPGEPRYVSRPLALDTTMVVLGRVRLLGLDRPLSRATWALIVVALLAIALASALVASRFEPAPVNGKIAYLVLGGGMQPTTDLVVQDPGGLPTQFTRTPETNEGPPRWSPDGQKLAFTRQSRGAETSQIFVSAADGSDEREIANETCHQLEWLPDSERIMCWAGDAVWLLGLDGSVPRGLRVQHPDDRSSSWSVDDLSPNGTQVLLERVIFEGQMVWPPRPPDAVELWRLDLLSGELRPMVRREGGASDQAQWSPDGSLIVFATEEDGVTGYADSISVFAADGSWQRELVPANPNVVVRRPTWTPDGSAVFYESRSTAAGRADGIWAVNVDTGAPRLVAEGWTIAAPASLTADHLMVNRSADAWSPNGKLLVVHDLQEAVRKLFTIERDGSNLTALVDCLCPFDWQPLRP